MAVEMFSDKEVNTIVANLPGVVNAVHNAANEMGRRAETKLAAHHHDGYTKIEVEIEGVDATVSVVDTDHRTSNVPSSAAIEYGHDTKSGKHVPGLHLITGGKD